jgi:hypothetical protein
VASAAVQASHASAGRSVCGSLSCRRISGVATKVAVASPATRGGTERLRSVCQPAPARATSMKGFQSEIGTHERAIAAAQVCATSSVSG